MMADVLAFPPRSDDKVVWRCNCGCMSFIMRADGELECCQCETLVAGEVGEWRGRLPDAPSSPEPLSAGDVKVTDLNHSGAALRRALGKADADRTALVVIVQMDGGVTTWGKIETAEQAEWFDRRLDDARKMLVEPNGA